MLDAIGIISKDTQKSVAFYGLLGVVLKEEGGEGHFEGSTPSGVRLMLDSVELIKKINPNWTEATGSNIVLCFKQASSAMVDEVFNQVTAAGFKEVKTPWDAFWGQRYASVQDPDGNQVDLFADL